MNLKYILPINHITNWIIFYTNEIGKPITSVKLQQLLYYCQVWHLIYLDAPLFLEDVQGWARGPVVPSQYQRFLDLPRKALLIANEKTSTLPDFNDGQADLLTHVVNKYISESDLYTELNLFREIPFINTRVNYEIYERGTDIVSYEDILEYYGARKGILFNL